MYIVTYFRTFLAYTEELGLHHKSFDEAKSGDYITAELSDGEFVSNEYLRGFAFKKTAQGYNLQAGGLYLCAEPDGIINHDRHYPSIWERFNLADKQAAIVFTSKSYDEASESKRFAKRVNSLIKKKDPVKLYFGAGLVPRDGFLNVDITVYAPDFAIQNPDNYFVFPFADRKWSIPDNSVDYIFHEDFIEHIDQINQWQFLAEALRTMKSGAWHRVNTPSLSGSMKRHSDFRKGAEGVYTGEREHEHISMLTHLQLKEIAEIIGYREVVFTTRDAGVSIFSVPDFRPGPDRDDVTGNIYADLLK